MKDDDEIVPLIVCGPKLVSGGIIGLDLGLKTGWSIADAAGRYLESGTFEMEKIRGESAGARFLRWRSWFARFLDDNKPRLVAYEQVHLRGGAAADLLVGLSTRVQEMCSERGIEYVNVHTSTLKLATTGKGNASKEEMARALKGLISQAIDDNEIDAFAVMLWAIKNYGGGA